MLQRTNGKSNQGRLFLPISFIPHEEPARTSCKATIQAMPVVVVVIQWCKLDVLGEETNSTC